MQAELNWYLGSVHQIVSHLDEQYNAGPFAEGCQSLITRSLTDSGSDYVSEMLRTGLQGFDPERLASYKEFQDIFRAEIIFDDSQDVKPLLGVPIIVIRNGAEAARAFYHAESGWWLVLSTRLIEFYSLWSILELTVLSTWSNPRNQVMTEHLLRIMGRLASDFYSGSQFESQSANIIADGLKFIPPGTGAVARMYLRFVLLHEYAHIWHDDHRSADRYSDLLRGELAKFLAQEKGDPRFVESPRVSIYEQEFRADSWAQRILERKLPATIRATSGASNYVAVHSGSALLPYAVAEQLAQAKNDTEYPPTKERVERLFAQVSHDSPEFRLVQLKRSLFREICKASGMPL